MDKILLTFYNKQKELFNAWVNIKIPGVEDLEAYNKYIMITNVINYYNILKFNK